MGEERGIDRRSFLAAAGAAGITAATGAGCGTQIIRTAARRPKVTGPVPRTFQQAMRGHVFNRGAPGFTSVAHIYNERFDGVLPTAVGRPLDVRDVQGAVRWAVGHGVPMRARSGGHSYAGYSTLSNGVVLDLTKLRSITVNKRARTATIGAGCQLIDVYAALAGQGVTIPAGSCPSVGVSGVTLGGGMGLAARALGMTADNLLQVQIVTADGRIRTVNRQTNPNLLWALRGGGGGNFGIVTQFTFRVHPIPPVVSWFIVNWPWSSASEALAAWQAWAPHARDQLTSIFHLNAGGGATSVNISGQYMGPASDLGSLLAPMRAVPGASVATGNQSYFPMQMRWAGCLNMSLTACHTAGTRPGGQLQRAAFNAKSDYVSRPFSSAGRATALQAVQRRANLPGSGALIFDAYGGAINRIPPTASAFVHRNQLHAIQYLTYNDNSGWLGQTWQSMRPYVSGQAYQNYIDARLPNWQQAYYGQNYARLKSIRSQIDPYHFFNFPQAIGR